jgi:hypothetical protein
VTSSTGSGGGNDDDGTGGTGDGYQLRFEYEVGGGFHVDTSELVWGKWPGGDDAACGQASPDDIRDIVEASGGKAGGAGGGWNASSWSASSTGGAGGEGMSGDTHWVNDEDRDMQVGGCYHKYRRGQRHAGGCVLSYI